MDRKSIRTNLDAVAKQINNKIILVTGAGGSIGSELSRQICMCNPSKLILLGHGENSIFNVERELIEKFPELSIESVIADIQDMKRLKDIFAFYRPQIIYHAAAHKHVPLMESNASEAVKNNIFGTRNVAQCALQFNAESFVFISSDKAVNPTNIMGSTKRLSELMLMYMGKYYNHNFLVVRLGNVLGSRGSVVPLFLEQIKHGGPVTVTHADMARYFITIPDAVQLILQASAISNGGEIFVLNMGEPIRIIDIARRVIQLSGLRPDEDIPIVFTGVRPGEKMVEELFTALEKENALECDSFYIYKDFSFPEENLVQTLQTLENLVYHEGAIANTMQIQSVLKRFLASDQS